MTPTKKTIKEDDNASTKKAAAKKTETAKKTTVKKTTAKKTDSTKKPAAKKTVKKAEDKTAKPTAKKPAAKKTADKPAVKPAEATAEAKVNLPTSTPAENPVRQESPKPAVQPAPVAQPTPASKPAEPAKPLEQAKPMPQPAPASIPAQPNPAAPSKPAEQPKPAPQPQQSFHPRHGHRAPEKATPVEASKKIRIVGQPTVKELAEKMNLKINDFIKKLMGMGIFATINQRLEKDMIELVIAESGFEAEMADEEIEADINLADAPDDPATLKHRSAVITIMGHVDHGKTSLLDAIRSSNVVEGEAGAITQHIGAYRVKTPRGILTFLDTPGHEAFTAMRARGAQVTDIVVLVVSATDGIMPQTIEAMEHAKAAGAPIIVAVNKIDLPGANVDRVKQDLSARGLVPEDWQGNTIFVEISAKKRINIDKLLEMIALQAEIMELKANPDRLGVGVILESKRDNKRGVVATVLVQKGQMKVGDPFIVGTTYGKIRALTDENGQRYTNIGPSVPAEVLGISGEPPHVGDTMHIMQNEKEARYAAEKRKLAQKEDSQAHRKHVSLMNLRKDEDGANTVKKLQLILKADVQGSIEAIKDALLRIPSDEVELEIILSAPGNVNESDILLAKASNAVVIGFHVDVENKAAAEAEREGIEIRMYKIIFELLEDIKAAMEGLLEPDVVEVQIGKATIKQVMRLTSGIISGSYVESGKMIRGAEVKIWRGGEVVAKGRIGGLKRFKDDVKEVEKGYECGILIEGFKGVQEGDEIECIKFDHVTRRIKM